jgi:hypothetical protein
MECISSPNTKWASSSQSVHPREIDGRDLSFYDHRRAHYHSGIPHPLMSSSSSYESRRHVSYDGQTAYAPREPHYMERYVTRYHSMGYRHPPSSYFPYEAHHHPYSNVPPPSYGGPDMRRPYPTTELRQEPPYPQHYVPHTPSHKFRAPHPITSSSEGFAPLKSPISQCIDVIIGAGKYTSVKIVVSQSNIYH